MKTCKVLKSFAKFDDQGSFISIIEGSVIELPDAKADRLAAAHVVEIIGGQTVSIETAVLPAAETADLPKPKRGRKTKE